VILWGASLTAAGYGTGLATSFGCGTAATQRWVISHFSLNANASSDTSRRNTAAGIVLFISDGVTTVEAAADLTSLDSDGFTINWSDAPASAWLMHYLCIGGTTITSAKAGTFTSNAGTGSQAVTDPGFQPSFVLFGSDLGSFPAGNAQNIMGVGAASSSSAMAACAFRDRDAEATTNSGTIQVSDACFIALNSGGTVGRRASLTSFDANGFTLNWSTASAAGIGYLALAGGSYKVGVDTQNTTTGTKATSGTGFTPTGLMLLGTNVAASAAENTSQMRFSLGASDGTTEGGTWIQSADGAADSDVDSRTYTDKVIGFSTQASTTDAEADVSAFGSDGFTLDWTTADATAREFIYAAFGDTPVAVTLRQLAVTGVGK
jgi:hypothetical protein